MSCGTTFVACALQLASSSAMFVEGLHKNYFAKTLFRQLTTILVRFDCSKIFNGYRPYRREMLANIRKNVLINSVSP